MAPFYADMCAELEKTADKKILSDLKAKNKAHLKKLDDKIEAAGQVEGMTANAAIDIWHLRSGDVSTDVRDAMIEKATYFSQIGDKEEALALYNKGKISASSEMIKNLTVFSSRSRKERDARNPTRFDVRYSPNRPILQRQEAHHWKRRKSKENDRRGRRLGSTKQTQGLRRPLLHYCQRFQVSAIIGLFLIGKRPFEKSWKLQS